MPVTAYDTRSLIRAVEQIRRPRTFFLDRYFPEIIEFDTETVDFDFKKQGRKLAPFVSPNVPGKSTRSGGYQTKSFKPAYIKPKDSILPSKGMKRRAGELYNGNMSAAQRLDAATMDTLDEHREAIIRRKEWMAMQALDSGAVTVVGEDYPSVTVDFTRDAALTMALAGGARWGQSGVKPLDLIEDWAGTVQSKSGLAPTDVVMDPLAWKLLRADTALMNLLDNRRQDGGSMQLGPVNVGDEASDARYVGNVGDFDFFVYQDFYEDDAGNEQKLMADNTVILTSPKMEGAQCHGAIQDAELGMVVAEYAPKVWNEKDPSVRMAMTQSAPLVVPVRVNHSMRIRVG